MLSMSVGSCASPASSESPPVIESPSSTTPDTCSPKPNGTPSSSSPQIGCSRKTWSWSWVHYRPGCPLMPLHVSCEPAMPVEHG